MDQAVGAGDRVRHRDDHGRVRGQAQSSSKRRLHLPLLVPPSTVLFPCLPLPTPRVRVRVRVRLPTPPDRSQAAGGCQPNPYPNPGDFSQCDFARSLNVLSWGACSPRTRTNDGAVGRCICVHTYVYRDRCRQGRIPSWIEPLKSQLSGSISNNTMSSSRHDDGSSAESLEIDLSHLTSHYNHHQQQQPTGSSRTHETTSSDSLSRTSDDFAG